MSTVKECTDKPNARHLDRPTIEAILDAILDEIKAARMCVKEVQWVKEAEQHICKQRASGIHVLKHKSMQKAAYRHTAYLWSRIKCGTKDVKTWQKTA